MKPQKEKNADPKSLPVLPLFSIADAAVFLRCSEATIYRMVKNNVIDYYKTHGGVRFSKYQLDKYLKEIIVLKTSKQEKQ
jgi:excisionase family DNA binding protein